MESLYRVVPVCLSYMPTCVLLKISCHGQLWAMFTVGTIVNTFTVKAEGSSFVSYFRQVLREFVSSFRFYLCYIGWGQGDLAKSSFIEWKGRLLVWQMHIKGIVRSKHAQCLHSPIKMSLSCQLRSLKGDINYTVEGIWATSYHDSCK